MFSRHPLISSDIPLSTPLTDIVIIIINLNNILFHIISSRSWVLVLHLPSCLTLKRFHIPNTLALILTNRIS